MTRRLPATASVAEAAQGGKLVAPAAARNGPALCALLSEEAPAKGRALELASGTGQHVTAFAEALPGLVWQPTDVAPERLASIDAHAADAAPANIRPALRLDATVGGWHLEFRDTDLVVVVNLLHLISDPEAQVLIAEAARACAPSGVVVIYGPFKRAGQLTSPGDARFDGQLRQSDPAIGYKNDEDVVDWLTVNGLASVRRVEMPANNLALVARR